LNSFASFYQVAQPPPPPPPAGALKTPHRSRRPIRPAALAVQQLEDRWTPASVSYTSGGHLAVYGPINGPVVVAQQADGRFQVSDKGHVVGTFAVLGNLSITTSTRADSITVQMASGKALPGNLLISSGYGNDTVNVLGGGGGNDSVGGGLFVDLNYGDDLLNVGAAAGKGVAIGGTTEVTGSLGGDTLKVGNNANVTVLRGDLLVHSVQTVDVGQGTLGDQVRGNVSVDLKLSPTSTAVEVRPLSVTANNNSVVLVMFHVVGGPLNDVVTVKGDTAASVEALLGEGNNTFALDADVPGSVTVLFGNGNDVVVVSGTSTVGTAAGPVDKLTLAMGDGANLYGLTGNFQVFGDMSITAGNTAQTISFGGVVAGDLSVALGNGHNTFSFNGHTGADAGKFLYTSGTGNDTVNFRMADGLGYLIDVTFGSGDNRLNLFSAGTSVVSGSAAGGLGSDTLDCGAGVVPVLFSRSGFESDNCP
jgi:hypothetical protein